MMPDVYTTEHIRQALASDPRVNEPELRVKVVAGRVVITGDVPTEERKRAIALVVHDLYPDLVVDDQTSVVADMVPNRPGVEEIA
jgi:hypothetical protein